VPSPRSGPGFGNPGWAKFDLLGIARTDQVRDVVEAALILFLFLAISILTLILPAVKLLQEHERGVIFRLGRLMGVRGPGLLFVMPFIDRMVKVDLRVATLDVPVQACVTRDKVKVSAGATLYYQVTDPQQALVSVGDFRQATRQAAQTGLDNLIGQHELDELLARREQVNEQLRGNVDEQSRAWGVEVSRVEIKDLELI
jgi:regulator of protease activity HflC (stomatin/prohibitin superfamily)